MTLLALVNTQTAPPGEEGRLRMVPTAHRRAGRELITA